MHAIQGVGLLRGGAEPQVVVEIFGHRHGLGIAAGFVSGGYGDLHVLEAADTAVAHKLRGTVHMLVRAALAVRPERYPRLLRGIGERAALRDGEGQWFLATDVLAGAHRGQRHRHVPVIRRADQHRIDIVARDDIAPIAMCGAVLVAVVFVDGPFRIAHPPRIHIADGGHVAVGRFEERTEVGVEGLAPHTDHADTDAVGRRGGSEQPRREDERRGGQREPLHGGATRDAIHESFLLGCILRGSIA